jgi:hypothetical protein
MLLDPEPAKANIDDLFVRDGASQVADGMRKCIHADNGIFRDDRVIKLYVAFDRPRDELCFLRGKLSLSYLFCQ